MANNTKIDRLYSVDNVVHVRLANHVFDQDGTLTSLTFSRHTISPGQDYSNEDDEVKAMCASIHTPELIASLANIK